ASEACGAARGPEAPDPLGVRLVRAAHASARGRELRLAFRAIEVLEVPGVVRSVQRTLRLGSERARGDASEVLTTLGGRQAPGLLALLHETGPLEDRIRGIARFADRPRSARDVVAAASTSHDPWVRQAAQHGPGGVTEPEERRTMERLLALREVPLFAQLRLDQLESSQRAMREEHYVRGEIVVREGEPGNELFLLLEGEVEVWIDHGLPSARLVNRLAAIASFGEMAALDDETRNATGGGWDE